MSKRRKPGEIVKRTPGSGFVSSAEPLLIRVPEKPAYEFDYFKNEKGEWEIFEGGEASHCMICKDPQCREWANLEIITDESKPKDWMYHVSECQMYDYE